MTRPARPGLFPAVLVLALLSVNACQKLAGPHDRAALARAEPEASAAESAPAEGSGVAAGGGDGTLFIRLDAPALKQVVPSGLAQLGDADFEVEADELLLIEAAESPLHVAAFAQSRHVAPKPRLVPIPDPTPDEPASSASEPGLRARDLTGRELGAFPLRRTVVAAEVSGPLGRTRVRQEYGNPYGEVIEAVYVFPLPAMAAVTDFVLEAAGRRIVGLVRPREEAERLYRQARARGQTASLLTQERPNLFTQSVANVEPGGEVTVELTYFESLAYEDGFFEYVFPMVVGPRYVPGSPVRAAGAAGAAADQEEEDSPGSAPAGGTAPPTDRVPDAHRVTPPVLAPGEASGHRVELTVTLETPLPIRELAVPSHRVEIDEAAPERRVVRLAAGDRVPDRDFVLRFRLAGEATDLGLLAHRNGADGFFLLSVQPPLEPADQEVMPREITFILDVSGSMTGLPLDLARRVIDEALARLRPADRFNLVYFASGDGQLWPEARPGTSANLAAARRFLAGQQGGGGTEMLYGVARALAAPHDPGSLQMFVFLTDGFVGNEAEILSVIEKQRGEARFFAFGIGTSVNRYLIDGIGKHGGGASHVVLPRPGEVERAAARLLAAIDSPVLVDLALDWGELPVEEVFPQRLPDLFAGRTLELVGRYRLDGRAGGEGRRPLRGRVVLSGRRGEREVRHEVEVELPAAAAEHAVLGPVWARHKIGELSRRMVAAEAAERPQLVAAITDLALEHRLASAYTAFVAVDESRVVGDGRPLQVLQPVELPEGVSHEGIFGDGWSGMAAEVAAWGLVLGQGEGGEIRVVALAENGEAARSRIAAGARLLTLDRVLVRDLGHLASLLLQAGGATVEVRFDPGGEVRLSAP